MISKSDAHVYIYKVKGHTSVVRNEPADALARHAPIHKYGHDGAFLLHTPDGSPFSQYWLAEETDETTYDTIGASQLHFTT